MSEEIGTPKGAQEPHIAAASLIRKAKYAFYIGLGLIVVAALGYLLAGWYSGYALSTSLQPIFVEILKGALTFTLIAVGGAYIKHLSEFFLEDYKQRQAQLLEDQRQRQAWLLEDQRQRQALLNEYERRCISVIEGLVEINSGFYRLRKSLESKLQPERAEDKSALRQKMKNESIDLEAQYGTLKMRAIRIFDLPQGDLGTKTKVSTKTKLDTKKTKAELKSELRKELEIELAATPDPEAKTSKRLDLLGEYYDVWRHTLDQEGTHKIDSEVRDKVWEHYPALLEYFEDSLLQYIEKSALEGKSAFEGGDRT